MKRLVVCLAGLLAFSSVSATHNVLFKPGAGATSHTCTAYERHRQQNHPDLALSGDNLVTATPVYTLTAWAAVTCTVVGAFPGSHGNTYYAEIPTTVLDPNLPDLQVIACIRAVGANGTASACVNAENYTPSSPTDPLSGGPTSAASANASDQ